MVDNQKIIAAESVKKATTRQSRFVVTEQTWKWILLLPAVIIVFALMALPTLWTLYAAFTDMHLYRPADIPTQFVGLENFTKLIQNKPFWRTVKNTVIFMLGVVPTQLVLGMVLAVAVNNIRVGKKLFRTWFLMPMMVSPVVVATVVGRMMFQQDIGPINEVLGYFGVEGIPWLTDPTWAMITLIIIDVWQWSSFMFLMLMAALQGVPLDLHEAARVDGANAWQSFWHISFPIMLPITVTALLIRIIDAFKVVDIVMVLTGGGPGQATETVTMKIFRTGVKGGDLAFGSSQAYFLVLIMLVFGGAYVYMSRRAMQVD